MSKLLSVSVAILFFALSICSFFHETSAVTATEDLAVTPEQKKILEMFRERIGSQLQMEYMKEDLYLLRWLKIKDFDLREAVRGLEENLRWRRENKMDTIHSEDWSDMVKEYPYSIDGHDKEGRPVGTVSIRSWDIRKAVLQGKMPRLQRYMDKLLDEISLKVIELRKQGKTDVTRWTLLTDTSGFNVLQHACAACTNLWANFLRSYEHHFPAHANAIIAINSPETFNLVFRLLQPSIPKTSHETIKLFGTNKSEWMNFLDSTIDRDQRTRDYGGTKP